TGEQPAAGQTLADSFSRQLCLNGEQEKCIKDIRVSFDAETEAIQTRLQEKRRAMVEELKKESPDSATLDKLIEDISRLQAEIQKKAVLNLLKEREVLTDEQKTTFFRIFEDHVCPREKGTDRDSAASGHGSCPQELAR
ncbi:MAG: periplasmic heavy metal sensor, partial [Acidobacteria bacterium]|nr:periplasmic heavy metal sensor [Acidobacteriota bacterium]